MALVLLFTAGVIFLLSLFFWGISSVIQLFLPLLIILSYLLIIVFLLGVLPSTYFKYMRPSLCVYSAMMSHALGVATWLMSFFIVIKAFGLLGIFFILAFKLLVPIAVVGAMIKGSWHIVGHLLLWISFTYGMRYYSKRLLNSIPRASQQGRGRVIDIDAVEVKG